MIERVELGFGGRELDFDNSELIEIVGKVDRLVGPFFDSLVGYVVHITKRIGTNRALC